MQIERTVCGVTTLGPGSRMAVWVNGCPRRCKGCVSPLLQRPEPRNERDIDEYFSRFDYASIDGVTISGGEPFMQTEELARLVRFLKKRGVEDILVYTGYTIEELRARGDEYTDYVLSAIAVLIDGPYVEEKNTDIGNLMGSDNQRVIFLSDKFKRPYADYADDKRSMQIFGLGNIELAVGIPDKEFVKNFKKAI